MSATIKIKNSSTAGAVPTTSDLVQGELAVNVTDKAIYTENASGQIVELGKNYTGFKNRLINAQGLINQRTYVSGTATTTGNQYTLDRWRVVSSGQNLTFTTTNNETTFTAPAGGVEQVIEGLNLESGTYTLSWTGTATATVDGTSVANGGQVTVVGGTNATVRFIGGTFKYPQFEKGSTATSFDYRSYSTEREMCKRYFIRYSGSGVGYLIGQVNGLTTAYFTVQAVMRAAPTVTYSSIAVNDSSITNAVTSASIVGFYSNSFCIQVGCVSGLTAGRAGMLSGSNSSSYLDLSAEL
jgi:hypothetical protein